MAITKEDYTTFTEVDPNSHLTVTAHHLDFDAYENEDCYLYKDYGADFFGDFTHKVDVKGSAFDQDWDWGYCWMLSNDIDDGGGLLEAKKTAVSVCLVRVAGTTGLFLIEYYNGWTYGDDDYYPITENTWYYLTITKTGTALTCKIYSDSARTILLDTLSRTLQADHKFRYLFGCNNYNTSWKNVCTLEIENLSIEMPIACDSPTPHFPSGCELLLHYDANNDGLINLDELTQSYTDYQNGIITEKEFDLVSDAYINDGINKVCPGCWEAPPKKTVTFTSVPAGANVTVT